MRDPVVRLEKELAHALDEEDFYRACSVKKELDEHLHHRQLVAMKSELRRALRFACVFVCLCLVSVSCATGSGGVCLFARARVRVFLSVHVHVHVYVHVYVHV